MKKVGQNARFMRDLFMSVLALFALCPFLRANNYDNMRTQWVSMMVGSSKNMSDPDIAASVNQVATTANNYWSSMRQLVASPKLRQSF